MVFRLIKGDFEFPSAMEALVRVLGRGVSARRAALLPWKEGEFLRHKEGLVSLGEGDF